jgi:nitrite reductase/ring-hydroxylating ferredoxin subunit
LTSTYPNFKNSINQFLLFKIGDILPENYYLGFGGIIVCTGFDGEYYAFDMCCPYEVKRTVLVYPNDIGQAVCKTCGSTFDIVNGSGVLLSGPSKEFLKKYRTSLSGDNILYVVR